MSGETRLDKETVKFYDELYPGKTVELSALLFGKKSFQMDDYLRNLVNAVYSIAAIGSTIFVGRGTHLILPRDRVLAVRLICSDGFRTERLASLLKIGAEEAGRTLSKIDREQKAFFKKAFGKKDAPASEFDLVVNFDHLADPRLAADVVARCFRKKFGIAAE
jgi:cytidylate kinase